MTDVFWLLRFATQASRPLAGSVVARIFGHLLGAATLALPAWAVGQLALATKMESASETVPHPVASTSPVVDTAPPVVATAPPVELGSSFFIWVVVAVIAMSLVKAGLRYLEQLLGHLSAFRLMGEMRIWIIDRIIPQAPAITDGLGAARVHTIAVRDVDRVEVFFAHTIAPAVTAVLIPIIGVITAWISIGPGPALALGATYAAGYLVALTGARKARSTAQQVASTRADISQFIADSIRLREELLTHNSVAHRLAGAAELDRQLTARLTAEGVKTGLRNGANSLRVWGGTTVVLAAALPAVRMDISTLPAALMTASLVAGTANSLASIERLAGSLPAGLVAIRRIRTLGAADPLVKEPLRAAEVPSASEPAIQLDRVSYRYPGAKSSVLTDVTVVVPRGATVGIAGPTGSGKSTITRLAQRHFDADAGTVRIGGIDVKELGSTRTQRIVAVVDQDPFLIEATVAENLRLGAPEAPAELLRWALSIAELDADQFPLEKPIARRGSNLSGGQKQRLALARTLVRAATLDDDHHTTAANGGDSAIPGGRSMRNAIVILDEATSHQDPITQQRIMSNLQQLDTTLVVIAHRLATLRDADHIYVIESGRVVEQGTFPALANAEGLFRSMLEAAE